MPDLYHEQAARTQGHQIIAGVDEAGRGPLAGPVVAAAVILPMMEMGWIADLQDSKKLSAARRADLYDQIIPHAHVGIGQCDVTEIDSLNILAASLRAMERAVAALPHKPDWCLIDGNRCPPGLKGCASPIVKGDTKSCSIAAASIIAKVTRDRIMLDLHRDFPQFGWDRNQGYPTKAHRAALCAHGPTPHHRLSFGPVREILLRKDAS